MRFKDIIKISGDSLKTHKSRSFLTMLGIIIGIGAVTVVMSIGDSTTKLIMDQIQSFGPRVIVINPGRPSEGSLQAQFESILMDSLTERDIDSLKNKSNVSDISSLTPSVMGSVSASYGSETFTTTLWGTGSEGFAVYQITPKEGTLFSEYEVSSRASVAILGTRVVEELFGSQDPIGEKIRVKNTKLTVIGTYEPTSVLMTGMEDIIITPYTTAQKYILGVNYFHEVMIEAVSVESVPGVVEDIKLTLRDNHDIKDPAKDDFIVTTAESVMKTVDGILGAITAFLAMVAAISLVVGGVGVMNIMFVSVTERTKEIGLRKAVGARNKNILSQFLAEALFLTGLGGILGIIGGVSFTAIATLLAQVFTKIDFPFMISLQGIILGLIVAGGTGLIFGIFPARHAAKKNPVEALRHE